MALLWLRLLAWGLQAALPQGYSLLIVVICQPEVENLDHALGA